VMTAHNTSMHANKGQCLSESGNYVVNCRCSLHCDPTPNVLMCSTQQQLYRAGAEGERDGEGEGDGGRW
jgi:hypothetical protein